jgi:hypothetical protein
MFDTNQSQYILMTASRLAHMNSEATFLESVILSLMCTINVCIKKHKFLKTVRSLNCWGCRWRTFVHSCTDANIKFNTNVSRCVQWAKSRTKMEIKNSSKCILFIYSTFNKQIKETYSSHWKSNFQNRGNLCCCVFCSIYRAF